MSDFDRLASAVPVDRVAARVTRPGVHFDDTKKVREWDNHWSTQPKVVELTALQRNATGFVDLTGVRTGRLVVVGLLPKGNRRKGAVGVWVVRCDCGDFETRKSKVLKQRRADDCCSRCQYNRALKEGLLPDAK